MKPMAALILVLLILLQLFMCIGVYILRNSTTETAFIAHEALARMGNHSSTPITYKGAQLPLECSQSVRTCIQSSAESDNAYSNLLNSAFQLLLVGLGLQLALAVCVLLIPNRVWKRLDG
jgi:hypothetical protein